ncbi:hypothetical protein ACLB2K_042126 [Fragaria x ananassa]
MFLMDYDPINWNQSPRSTLGEVPCAHVDPSLPPPWKEVIDGAGRFYYWNTETNATQFDKPAYQVPFPSLYPQPVPIGNIYVPPSSTLVNPSLSPPPHYSPHLVPPFQSPSVPASIPNPTAVQIINTFVVFQQGVNECFNDFREGMCQTQERLHESRRLIQELRVMVPTAATIPNSGPQYLPEDPTLTFTSSVPSNPPPYTSDSPSIIHPTYSHPTQPIYLHRKQLRVLRRRV